MSDLHTALRTWAKGIYPAEAAVELLIRQGKAIYEGAPWLREGDTLAGERLVYIDVDELVNESGAWSGGERRVVDIAASLLDPDRQVNLNHAISGLDRPYQALVLAAIAHAAGSHEGVAVRVDEHGRAHLQRAGTLFGWPDDEAAAPAANPSPREHTPPDPGHGPGL